MRFPQTPEEAAEFERKIAVNDKVGDWVAPFPPSGIGRAKDVAVDNLLNRVGSTPLPIRPKK